MTVSGSASQAAPVALVTGAGRRLGNALARSLAAAGYKVALHAGRSAEAARATVAELEASGTESIALVADLRDDAATRAMVEQAYRHFGRLDALVNNAAVWHARPLEQVTVDDLREHLEVNTLATFVCCQTAGLLMVEQPTGGAIVNLGDWAVSRPYRHYAHYFASKGCIPALTRAFAVELGTRNPRVRVNAILPGPVLIPDEMTPAERRRVVEATLAKREGTPDDVAEAVLFLLRQTFVTGVCLPVDGGRSIYSHDEIE